MPPGLALTTKSLRLLSPALSLFPAACECSSGPSSSFALSSSPLRFFLYLSLFPDKGEYQCLAVFDAETAAEEDHDDGDRDMDG